MFDALSVNSTMASRFEIAAQDITPRIKISILVDTPVPVESGAAVVRVPVLIATATAAALEILVAAGVPFGVEIQDAARKIENKDRIEK